jgi:hypothetical protein
MSQRAKTRQGSGVSLKKQILEWWAALPEPTTTKVADLCGTSPGYVRVCVRQRKDGGTSAIDKRYLEKFKEEVGAPYSTAWYRASEENRQKHKAHMDAYFERHWGSREEGIRHFNAINAARKKVRV